MNPLSQATAQSVSSQTPVSQSPSIEKVYDALEEARLLPSDLNAIIAGFCFSPSAIIDPCYNPGAISNRLEKFYTARYQDPTKVIEDLAASKFTLDSMLPVQKRLLKSESITVLDVRAYKLSLDEIKSLAELFPNAVIYTKYFTRELRNFKRAQLSGISQQIKQQIDHQQLQLQTLTGQLEQVKTMLNTINATEELRNKNRDNIESLVTIQTALEAPIDQMKQLINMLKARDEQVTAELARLSTLSE